ncbi:MAG: dihydroorotase [Geminicoccaceae bacterium]
MSTIDRLTIRRPDDWHLHLRDGAMLEGIAGPSMEHVGRAIIMPNLIPPVVTGDDARAYRDRILKALERSSAKSTPASALAMTLYLTETTDPDDVAAAAAEGLVQAVKLYPAGATTNSDSGVRNFETVIPVLERMAEIGLPLCVHGEATDPDIDIFDREAVFIEQVLDPIRRRIGGLKVVMEHVTTKDAVDYVTAAPAALGATITPHHLILNRNHLLVGGIKPHYYCLPIVKRERHRLALRKAATSGDGRFFLGTDSAPHADHTKEAPCGCAGVFNAPNTLSCLAHVFEEEGALDKLELFCSLNGPAFYGLPPNQETITLVKGEEPMIYPDKIETDAGPVTVFDPGFSLFWRVA